MKINLDRNRLIGYSGDARESVKLAVLDYYELLTDETDRVEKIERRSNTTKEVIGSHVIKAQIRLKNEYFQSNKDKFINGVASIIVAVTSVIVGSLWGTDVKVDPVKYYFFIGSVACMVIGLLVQFYYTALKK